MQETSITTKPLDYQTTFILDKSHFIECFQESVQAQPFLSLYLKAMMMIVIGASLVLFSALNPYAAWFIFSLGVLEVVSTYYRQPWWVMRQMLSKVAKAEVTLEITDEYIRTHSFYNDNKMFYSDITGITATVNGWLIMHKSGRHYIANRCLTEAVKDFLKGKCIG
jgi:hypothetical protein